MRNFLILMLICFSIQNIARSETTTDLIRIPRIQTALTQLAQKQVSGKEDRRAKSKALEEIRKFSDNKIVAQLVLFVAGDRDKYWMVPGFVTEQLNISDSTIAGTLIDHLDHPTADVRKEVRGWLKYLTIDEREHEEGFVAFEGVLLKRRRAGKNLPDSTIRFLYNRDAKKALFTMMEVYEINDPDRLKSLRWANHVVQEVIWREKWGYDVDQRTLEAATDALRKMSESESWWVRMYVAEIMQSYQSLHQDELAKEMKNDAHRLVKSVIASEREKPEKYIDEDGELEFRD